MTDREKEIRDAERKAMAEVRQWKRKAAKKLETMTLDEKLEYWRKGAEELNARRINVG